MSLPFSRSTQSLASDRYRLAKIGLILAVMVVFAMIAWFFLAQVSIYEQSRAVELSPENRLLVEFDNAVQEMIHTGQPGTLQVNAQDGGQPITAEVVVFGLDEASGKVEVVLTNRVAQEMLQPGKVPGLVNIRVARLAPYELLVKSLAGNTQPGTTSPRSSGQK